MKFIILLQIASCKFESIVDNTTFKALKTPTKNPKTSEINNRLKLFILASLPFLSSGLVLGYLLFLPIIDRPLYLDWTSWPYLALIFSIILTAAFLAFPKFRNGKYTFQQFYCLAFSTVLYLTSGLLFALTKRKYKIHKFSFWKFQV